MQVDADDLEMTQRQYFAAAAVDSLSSISRICSAIVPMGWPFSSLAVTNLGNLGGKRSRFWPDKRKILSPTVVAADFGRGARRLIMGGEACVGYWYTTYPLTVKCILIINHLRIIYYQSTVRTVLIGKSVHMPTKACR